METTEIIAELRKAVAIGDSPVFCGASYVPKRVAMEAADALERQSRRLRELSETALRLGDEIKKQHERMMGDLISRSALLESIEGTDWYTIRYDGSVSDGAPCEEVAWYKATEIYDAIGRAPAVEAEPVVHAHWKAVLEPNTVDNYGRPVYHAECSACGCKWGHVREAREWFKRCRLCGAHMDEEVAE